MPLLLAVPVHLDVISVEGDPIPIAGPLADFTKLPWEESSLDKDSPYLAETIAAAPFKKEHALQTGLHFHWSLPTALSKTSSIGIVYKHSFESVFGIGPETNAGELNGDAIWDTLKSDPLNTVQLSCTR